MSRTLSASARRNLGSNGHTAPPFAFPSSVVIFTLSLKNARSFPHPKLLIHTPTANPAASKFLISAASLPSVA